MVEVDHRSIAVSTYNACWDLLESARSAEDDRNLLSLAFTSRYHWLQTGGATQWAMADWMVSRCAAAIGEGSLSMTSEPSQQDRELIESQIATV